MDYVNTFLFGYYPYIALGVFFGSGVTRCAH
jgi:nitrate reductase gamma subunit